MRIFTTLILLILGIVSSSNSQWVSNYGGNNSGDINFSSAKGNAVTVDNEGNCYVTGYCYEVSSGNDIIIIRYTLQGDTAWVRSYNGTLNSNDEGAGICVDSYGNVYVIGSSQNAGRSYDVTLLKYDSEGNFQWAQTFAAVEASKVDKGLAIAVGGDGFIYVTGYCTESDSYQDIVTLKYDSDGNKIWSRQEDNGVNRNAQGLCITVSSAGNIYVAGYTSQTVSNTDMALIKYDSSGTKLWMQNIQGQGNSEDKAWGIAVDETDNVYTTGYVTASAYNTDCYTAKYDSEGTLQWSTTYNGEGNSTDKAWGIIVDTDGSTYITGESRSSDANYITIKYDYSGAQIWASDYNGTGNGVDVAASIGIITTNNTKSIVVTGKSWGTNYNYDYATARYDSETGEQTQVNRYSMSGLTNDLSKDLVVSDDNKVIVTGYSQLLIESNVEQSYVSTLMLNWGQESELITNNNAPGKFTLHQNYPNPFNPSTTIKFDISYAANVKLVVYDILGRVVDVLVNQDLNAGSYNFTYTNKSLSSGIYFYELTAGSIKEIKKMTLVK